MVHLGSESDSEVTIEVHMSRDRANELAALETARLVRLNPGRADIPPQTPGIAALNILGLYTGRFK